MGVYKREYLDEKGNPVWYFIFPHNGRRYRQSGFTTKRQAEMAEAKRKNEVMFEGRFAKRGCRRNLAEVFEEYFPFRSAVCAATTVAGERTRRTPLLRFFGKKSISSISVADVQDYVTRRVQEGMANRTVNLDLVTLRNVFKFAKLRQYVTDNPAKAVPNLPEVITDHPVPTAEQMKSLFGAALEVSHQLYCWVMLMAYTGLRPSEAFRLSWNDIDFEANRIYVRPKVEQRPLLPEVKNRLKTRRYRAIRLYPALRATLLEWKAQWDKAFAGGPVHNWVFFHPRSHNKRAKGFYRTFRKLVEGVGLKDFTYYTFRHYFATRALESGANSDCIRKTLGHMPSSRILEKHYAHLSTEFENAEMAKVRIV